MFYIWQQVSIYWGKGLSPLHLALTLHPHALRYLIVYPFFVLSEWTEISSDIYYTIFIYLCFIISIYTSHLIFINFRLPQRHAVFSTVILTIMYGIGIMYANGRGIIASLGILILFFTFMQWNTAKNLKKITLIFFSFVLCSVSTGVFFCYILSFLFLFLHHQKELIKKYIPKNNILKNRDILLSIVFYSSIFSMLLLLAIQAFNKNYEYYGTITNMLDHGLPGLSNESNIQFFIVFSTLVLAALSSFFTSKMTTDGALIIAIFMLSGLFGKFIILSVAPLGATLFLIYVTGKKSLKT